MTSTNDNIILRGPAQYHEWFDMIKASVLADLWEYFDPETEDEPIRPDPVTYRTIRETATSFAQLTTLERSQYNLLKGNYNHDLAQYQRILAEDAKLRKIIRDTVDRSKRPQLKADMSIREWLQSLEASTKPGKTEMSNMVKVRHRTLMGYKYNEWPTGGPAKWISQ